MPKIEIPRGVLQAAVFTALVAALLGACGGDGGEPGDGGEGEGGSFETAWPGADGSRGADGESAAGGTADTTAGSSAPAQEGGNFANGADSASAARIIQEADVIQVQGDTLYALSRMSGLNVIDVADPGDLKLLGAFRDTRDAQPFEMYVEDGVAMVMFSGWGRYEWVEGEEAEQAGYAWVNTSEVVALDVADPGDIALLGTFDVPGEISDSRIVGEVLYVVGYEDGYCWDCDEGNARTVVSSLDVSDPRNIEKVDELTFADDDNEWGWNRRSVTVTTERMYVAGPEYGRDGPVGSTIQVIDITDPEGDLVMGASVQATGEISSRWQMDEYEGVLRVISQPPGWRLSDPPRIQTFTVTSSDEITPLGAAEMVLPRPEQLQAVRFDGERAYAITFERTDPFFTIDLSDPAAPRQAGELEIPGFVYHMEPRGERVIGLGFDQGNVEGAITVSLFDVSELDNPTMLSRVNFGGEWGWLPEDQDRIHKVFRVLDDEGLILAPFSSEARFEGDAEEGCYRGQSSHVQLIDFTADTLISRDQLDTRGEARRALLLDDHVLTVSDQQVAAYDVSDRSAAVERDTLLLARNVERAVALEGDMIARLSRDWWGNDSMMLDVVAAADADDPTGAGEIAISGLFSDGDGCENWAYVQDVIAEGNEITVLYERESSTADGKWEQANGVVVVDASDPTELDVVGQHEWTQNDGEGEGWWRQGSAWAHGIPVSERSLARFDGGVAMIEGSWMQESRDRGRQVYRMRVIDLRDPAEPGSTVLNLSGAGEDGYYGLSAQGTTVSTSHHEPVEGSPGVTRFYLDRFDLSDPSAPTGVGKINVPGVVVHDDPSGGYAVTVDLTAVDAGETTWEQCASGSPIFDFRWPEDERGFIDGEPTGPCTNYSQSVKLVSVAGGVARLQASHEIDDDAPLRRLSAGDGLLVGTTGRSDYYGVGVATGGAVAVDCFGPCGGYYFTPEQPEQLVVLSGLADGELNHSTLELDLDADPWYGWWGASSLIATGRHALVTGRGELAVIDLSDPQQPQLERTEPFSGYLNQTSVRDDRVVLALGEKGCRVIDL